MEHMKKLVYQFMQNLKTVAFYGSLCTLPSTLNINGVGVVSVPVLLALFHLSLISAAVIDFEVDGGVIVPSFRFIIELPEDLALTEGCVCEGGRGGCECVSVCLIGSVCVSVGVSVWMMSCEI